MGGGGSEAPEMSPEERQMIKTQRQLLEEAAGIIRGSVGSSELLAPFFYESMGLSPVMDSAGKITGFNKITDPMQAQRQNIEQLLLNRQEAALKGELPVDPALMRDLGEQEELLKNRMAQQLGPGWETSSAGIEALGDFSERRSIMLDAARRGDMNMAQALGLQMGNYNQGMIDSGIARGQGIASTPASFASLLSGTSQGYASPLASMAQARQIAAQQQSANAAGFGSLVGTLGSAAIFAACWVAREVFGYDNPKWIYFREWMLNQAPSWLRELYLTRGEEFADFIHDKPVLKRYVRRLMEQVI